MQDENREKLTEEPREVVQWYVRPEGREVVDYYVQPRPMPAGAAPPPPPPGKRSRKGLWIFLIAMGVLMLAVAAGVIWSLTQGSGETPPLDSDGDGDSDASSIVNIFKTEKTTIPRVKGEAGVSLTCEAAGGEKLTIQDVYAKVNPATVLVVADQGENASVGTGIIMTSDGYIVTNAHVISGGRSCWIALDTGYTYDAELVGYDEDQDLAVLKAVDAEDLPTAEFGDSDQCRVGDTVYAIGNPLGLGLAISSGIIGSTAHELDRYALPCIVNSADISRGSSGGALMNAHGQVIGVTSGAYTYGNNMYLAVPVNPVMTADLTGPGWTLEEVKAIENAKKAD